MKLTNLVVAAALFAVSGLLGYPILRAQAPAQALPGARVVPIQITGDPAARFSMVVMGDGYTEADMPKYRAHLDKHLNVLWSIEPFRSYRNYINVYSVEVVSPSRHHVRSRSPSAEEHDAWPRVRQRGRWRRRLHEHQRARHHAHARQGKR
jgi:hypothetical protein